MCRDGWNGSCTQQCCMCDLWGTPATCVISRLSAESELQKSTDAECDTEEDYVDSPSSLEALVQPAINRLRFQAERRDRTFLRDSCAFLPFALVFFISCLSKRGHENGNYRMIGLF